MCRALFGFFGGESQVQCVGTNSSSLIFLFSSCFRLFLLLIVRTYGAC
jgi:hypothetical protein